MISPSVRRVLATPRFLGLLATNVVLGLTTALVLPFLSLWATHDIGMSRETLGTFMTVQALSAITISTLIARWSDRGVSRRTLLLIGSCAGALGHLGFAYVRDPLLLLFIGSSAWALASISFAQFFAHVREHLEHTERAGTAVPLLMGILRACYALAWTVGPVLAARLVSRFGYPAIFQTAASLFIVFAAGVIAFVPRGARVAAAAPTQPVTWGLGQPRVLAHAVAFALMFAAFTIQGMNLPLFLTDKLGATVHGVGAAFAVSPLFEILFMVGFGHLAALGHQRRVIVVGAAAAVGYFAALPFITAVWHVYPLQVLNAAAHAVTTSVAIPFFQDLMPGQPGAATTLYSNALKAGSLLGFGAFGLLASSLGHARLFWVCAGFALVTLAIVSFARQCKRTSHSR
ncbi:MAG TPA: sugar efflux transporter [Polyangiaceae bacterium]|nr:sugar efflux transporter [Polyangiaceae bacterium]